MNDSLSEAVIGAAFRVYRQLGFGFLESVYETSLCIELTKAGIAHESQVPIRVYYDDVNVGNFVCDLLVAEQLLVELKAVTKLAMAHEVQLVNYLAATRTDVGLLINFGPSKVEVKRKYRHYKKEGGQDEDD